jgi:hypothetical protein
VVLYNRTTLSLADGSLFRFLRLREPARNVVCRTERPVDESIAVHGDDPLSEFRESADRGELPPGPGLDGR